MRRDKRKEQIVQVMGGKCQLCGYDKCFSALELHHLLPSEKEFSFAKQKNKAWEDIQDELKKCILVCANCHREIHAKQYLEDLKTSYNLEEAIKISEELFNIKHKQNFYCKKCGTVITYGAIYCKKCASFLQRKVIRPTREELKRMIRETSFTGIGKYFQVSDNAVRKWCKKYQLPSTKTEIKKYSDEEWNKL